MATAIFLTGLLAGILDGAAAVAAYMIRGGRAPARIFNYIASGVWSRKKLFISGHSWDRVCVLSAMCCVLRAACSCTWH